MKESTFRSLFNLMRLAVIGVFAGRAWQHLYWDAPYRALLWDERWFGWFVEGVLGYDWHTWVTSAAIDAGFQQFIKGLGVFYLLCVLAAIFIERVPRLARGILWVGGFSLVFLAFLYTKEHFFIPAQFFEYSLQFGCPFFFVALYRRQRVGRGLLNAIKVATALTFICHGLFALGLYPTPGYFVDMVMRILGIGEPAAVVFLRVAGVLDLLLAVLLFLPAHWAIPALAYAVFWGLATTVARVWAYIDAEALTGSLAQWAHESVMRVPHFIIPLFLLLYIWEASHRAEPPGKPLKEA